MARRREYDDIGSPDWLPWLPLWAGDGIPHGNFPGADILYVHDRASYQAVITSMRETLGGTGTRRRGTPGAVAPAAIVVAMTAAGQPHPIPTIPPLPEGASPRAIRAALITEEREEFDQAYRRALADAAETLELAGVLDTLEHWRRRAIMSADPQAYRRMLRRAAHLLSGEDVPEDEPLAQLKERLARLGV